MLGKQNKENSAILENKINFNQHSKKKEGTKLKQRNHAKGIFPVLTSCNNKKS